MRLHLTRLRLSLVALFARRSPRLALRAFSFKPIAGADDLGRLRLTYDKAKDELHAAADAVDAAAKTGDEATLDAASARLTTARETADKALYDVELYERTQEARRLSMPDTPDAGGIGVFSGRARRSAGTRVTSEPLTYEQGNGRSFFGDLRRSREGDRDAMDRLGDHRREMQAELADEEYALSSTDTAGGDFVPPLYLFDAWAGPAHSSRPFTSVLNRQPLPERTDTLNIPRMTSGATVASQADNAAVSNTDPATDTVSTPVRTIAGMVDVSLQSLERSMPGLDEIVFADLFGAYAELFETQILNGTGSGNTMKGVLQVSGINLVTYTDASPTVPELYPKIAEAAALVTTGRRKPADVICMHPRRWAWILAARDTSNRPLVVPASGMNPVGEMVPETAEGFVGSLIGIPVVASSQIPTTNGAGTNEDVILLARREELLVFDELPIARVFEDVGSGTLTVRLRLHGYGAFCADRYPKGITAITGTGLATPTFA
jgi:HK97 family phage major capsid protein